MSLTAEEINALEDEDDRWALCVGRAFMNAVSASVALGHSAIGFTLSDYTSEEALRAIPAQFVRRVIADGNDSTVIAVGRHWHESAILGRDNGEEG